MVLRSPLIVLVLFAVGCQPPGKIVRGPYLQQTGATSTFIVWQTDRPLTGAVHYGTRSTRQREQRAPNRRTMHAVRLHGLSPGTTYVYRISAGGRTTRVFRFTTATADAQSLTFGVIGDFGSGSSAERRNAELLEAEPVDLVLTVGDNVYPLGTEREYPRALFGPFGSLMHRIALWPSLGNHDYGAQEGVPLRGTAAAYLRNFVLPARPGGERYYSFRRGNAEFLAIDSERTSFAPGSPQYRWIARTLARSHACWKIPYFHHPVHPEYVHPMAGDLTKQAQLERWLVPLFERYGVKLVLTGHEHNYVRTRPLIGGHPNQRGIVYIISGGGGAALDPLPPQSSPLSAARGRFFQHLLVSIHRRRAEVRAIDAAGRVRDRVRLAC